MSIYISIGSNVGNRINHLQQAVSLLKKRYFNNICCSIILETECILPENAPIEWDKPYLNMIVKGDCDLSPEKLLQCLKEIEQELGRPVNYEKWSPRVIDLDILLWDNIVLDSPILTIPHSELKNRNFLLHLLALMGEPTYKAIQMPEKCFIRSFTISPKIVGIVNITHDSFSDGKLYNHTDQAVAQIIKLAAEGASVIDIGAQSTRPGAVIQGAGEEYIKLKPIFDVLKPLMENGTIAISIDSFWPSLIHKILDNYPIAWVNDVKGELDTDTLKLIAKHECKLCIMHSLGIPPKKDMILPENQSPIEIILDWAKIKMERLLELGFTEESIIIDPGIGFGKSACQNIEILRHVESLKNLGVKTLIGHSRKSYIEAFSKSEAQNRDIETIAISSLIVNKADYLRVHNVADHMRFFVAQHVVKGGSNANYRYYGRN